MIHCKVLGAGDVLFFPREYAFRFLENSRES